MEILKHPSPVLAQRTPDFDPRGDTGLKDLVAQMAKAMYEAPGVGLAAPQVGVLKRVIVYDIDEGLHALCNPRIVRFSEENVVDEEGCLSLPGVAVPVARSVEVVCEALDLLGNPVSITARDLHARVLQHEIDHLDGVLIIDRASPEDRKAALRQYAELMSSAR